MMLDHCTTGQERAERIVEFWRLWEKEWLVVPSRKFYYEHRLVPLLVENLKRKAQVFS
jgi:hypothetical protein